MTAAYVLFFMSPFLGAALGSFFAATVMRGENLTKAKGKFSVDDKTGERLKWFELFPIFSFILLRGKSRYTGEKLDLRMWLSELLGFFVFLVLAIGSFINLPDFPGTNVEFLANYLITALVLGALFYLAVFDMFTYSIPANITLILTLLVVGLNLFVGVIRFFLPEFAPHTGLGTLDNLVAAIVAGGFIWLLIQLTRQKGMGEGDVYIAVIMGIMLGGVRGIAAFYVTVIGASLVGIALMAMKKKLKGLIVPLVPFMLIGFVFGATLGNAIANLLFFSI